MREMDHRMWVEHHDQLSLSIDRGLARLRAGLARLANWDGTTGQLIAMTAAFMITGFSLAFTSSTAA